jgi:MFS transporter, AAHS family, 4-hydroxybenzoate transporter
MTEAALSNAETALENQRIGRLQIRVAAICTVVQMCDGYDVNSIGVTVPSLTHAWNLTGPAFATAFLWSSIGIMVGALSAGPIGDRFGRKPLLIASLLIFGLASLGSAVAGAPLMIGVAGEIWWAGSGLLNLLLHPFGMEVGGATPPELQSMSVLRFFTGLGIGGAFPGAATLTGDYAPHRRRALMIMLSFTGAPIGGFLCAQAAGLLLPAFHQGLALTIPLFSYADGAPITITIIKEGWQSVFLIGGIVPLALVVVMLFWLPESPRFLAAKGNLSPRQAALLQRLDITPGQTADHGLDLAQGNPIKMLFGKGYALQTVLMWIIFFCSLMNLFLFVYWLPEVLHLTGFTPAEAARATSFRELGAILAVLYLGVLIDRFGPERALALNYAAGIVFIAAIALFAMPYLLLVIVIFFSGMMIIGSQTGANAACGKLYPARMRTSGLGWALGIGRLGGIAAPLLGGYLLKSGMAPREIFLSACGFALIAAVATALLAFRGARAEVLTPKEVAP